jgi:hypothetical protein
MVSIGAVALAGAPNATAASDAPTFDTYSSWAGDSVIGPFGHPNTTTYGQVITVPAGLKKVEWFTYYMGAGGTEGTLKVRGEVYGWDGTKATREIAETRVKDVEVTGGDPTFNPVKFKLRGAKVRPGKQYVLFASISKDYEESDPNVTTNWPVHTTDVLPGGNTVFLNDSGDESQWTSAPWSQITTYDMAFKAKLK